MNMIGQYTQVTEFSSESAGTAEWCKATKDGIVYFVKLFHNPVYPSKDLQLGDVIFQKRVERFHKSIQFKNALYERLRSCSQANMLIVPTEVIGYNYHICTISKYIQCTLSANDVHNLSPWQRIVLMRTLTLVLMSVHDVGVVHSDIKPSNILFFQDEAGNCQIRLIDFDGSFFADQPPKTADEAAGDQAYFAPEALQLAVDGNTRLDYRMDIFSLGLVFHYLWCGKLPLVDDAREVCVGLLMGKRVHLDESVPPLLRELIGGMLEKEPEKRTPLERVFETLGKQLEMFPQTLTVIANPHAEKLRIPAQNKPEQTKQAAVKIVCRKSDRTIIKTDTIWVEYGTTRMVSAPTIPGYLLDGLKYPVKVTADESGNVKPVEFLYKAATPTHVKRSGKWLILLTAALTIACIAYFLLQSIEDHKSSNEFRTAVVYTSASKPTATETATPKPAATKTATPKPAATKTATPKPAVTKTATPKPAVTKTETPKPAVTKTATPKPARKFYIHEPTYDCGWVTISWTDSEDKGPYTVSYRCADTSRVEQTRWILEKNVRGKSIEVNDLAPGHQYTIYVSDRNGDGTSITISGGTRTIFEDGALKASSIDIDIAFSYFNQTEDASKAKKISQLRASTIIKNIDTYYYGLRYTRTMPALKYAREYLEQMVIIAPNGYTDVVVTRQASFPNVYEKGWSYYYYCAGWQFFGDMYAQTGTLPDGRYTVELYWDGMLVNTSCFFVEQ